MDCVVQKTGVLISYVCPNKIPQTRWLYTTEIYSLTVVEAKGSESRCWQDHTIYEVSKGGSFPVSFNFRHP